MVVIRVISETSIWKSRNEVLHNCKDDDMLRIRSMEAAEIMHYHSKQLRLATSADNGGWWFCAETAAIVAAVANYFER